MWRPPINFVTIHYAYIILISLLSLPILYPGGFVSAIDAYHFGVSASTESGLNTVDLKELQMYQQLYLYFVPMVTNMAFINIIIVLVRLWYFRAYLKKRAPALLSAKRRTTASNDDDGNLESGFKIVCPESPLRIESTGAATGADLGATLPLNIPTKDHREETKDEKKISPDRSEQEDVSRKEEAVSSGETIPQPQQQMRITFDPSTSLHPKNDSALYIPGPRDRERGHPLVEVSKRRISLGGDDLDADEGRAPSVRPGLRRRRTDGSRLAEAKSMDRVADVAQSLFVIGVDPSRRERRPSVSSSVAPALNDRPFLSRQATLGRNSQFYNLTSEDREALGGIEYRSLKLLLKIVAGYFFGGHLFGAICLLPWIRNAPAKYRDYLAECGQNESWWAIYSAQTMWNNLGLTLTPDSMISFRDAEWPMFIMSFLALAGNTFYPVFLRLVIWAMAKLLPKSSSLQDPLNFLLEHPRRCFTLLFPSRHTWALFGILFALNFVDTLLIIVLDLHNPEVAELPVGQRILAAIFQAASARHTGTSSFVLSEVNPAVQLSLVVMMYISVFPIAISIRASNTYEERSLGVYQPEEVDANEQNTTTSYLIRHMQNQLSFDLWYIFLGVFCICIAEAGRIMDLADPAFTIFAILFEVMSAYANVGLSLGVPTANVSLCGKFTTFSKIVICIMMIRGRHRGLPYEIDRAIMLPDERLLEDNDEPRKSSDTRRSKMLAAGLFRAS